MNIKYTYVDGKVIVSDEYGNQKLNEYYDNLEDVLVQENLIEELEKKITELNEKVSQIRQEKPKKFKPSYTFLFLFCLVLGYSLSYLVFNSLGLKEVLESILRNKVACSFIFIPVPALFTFVGIDLDFLEYCKYKDLENRENGIEAQLDYSMQQLVKEKEKLINLKSKKTRDCEYREFRTVNVPYLERLKALRKYLKLYYELGSQVKHYHRSFEQGCLEEELEKEYDEDSIIVAKQFIEDKGRSFVKKD